MSRAWMPFYIGDYLRDTLHLSTEEHGAYLLLIFAAWDRGNRLPEADLAAITRATARRWAAMRDRLAALFSVEDGIWMHRRVQRELDRVNGITGRATAGAESRWGERGAKQTRSERLAEARAKGRHSAEEWGAMVEVFKGACVRCGGEGEMVKDHIRPIYQGGSDGIENLQPLCRRCNSAKGPDSTDHRSGACENWQERLAECLAKRLPNASYSQSQSQREPNGATSAPSAEAEFYRRGKEVLGRTSGGLLKKLLAAKGGNTALARAALETASQKGDAAAYLGGVIRGEAERTRSGGWDGSFN